MIAMRVFTNHYLCDDCPNEWQDELLVKGPSWCPCCDREVEPYLSTECEELTDEEECE